MHVGACVLVHVSLCVHVVSGVLMNEYCNVVFFSVCWCIHECMYQTQEICHILNLSPKKHTHTINVEHRFSLKKIKWQMWKSHLEVLFVIHEQCGVDKWYIVEVLRK